MNSIPPQAYTRDTLAEAYEWLKNQGGPIKELAKDADSLVALYLQHKRRQNHRKSLGLKTDPVSSQAFKEELKDLAQGFNQFEQMASPSPDLQQAASLTTTASKTTVQVSSETTTTTATPASSPFSLKDLESVLDPQSLQSIRNLQKKFNLSSPIEALRALIALGHEEFQKKFPSS
ncbi:MAG: hypothetical protein D6797_01005 [Bdellovibrio sp.]|nr:MAG: hypothetical protein D6797_01005 [Bdellovibrio sp.]